MASIFTGMGDVLNELARTTVIDLAKRGKMPPLLSMVRKEIVTSNLIKIEVDLPVGQAQTALIDAPTLYPSFPVQPDTGVYNWDRTTEGLLTIGTDKVFGLMKIIDSDVTIAKARGKNAVKNLYQKGFNASVSRLFGYLEAGIINGNGFMLGFNQLFSQNGYAGLTHTLANYTGMVDNKDYYSFWRPYSATYSVGGLTVTGNDAHGANAATAHSLAVGANIVDAFDTFTMQLDSKGRTFSSIITTPEVSANYQSLYRREATFNIQNGQVGLAEMGITTPTYRGAPIISMRGLPANTVYFINLEDIYLATLAVDGGLLNDDLEASNEGGLSVGIGALAKDTATVTRYEIYTVPQLVVQNTNGLNRLVIAA